MKKYAKYAVGAFIVFYLLSAPEGAARTVKSVFGDLESAGQSLSIFVNEVGE